MNRKGYELAHLAAQCDSGKKELDRKGLPFPQAPRQLPVRGWRLVVGGLGLAFAGILASREGGPNEVLLPSSSQ